jgi:structural maintenance of chromosome 2
LFFIVFFSHRLEGLKKSIESGEEQLEAVAAAVKSWEEEVTQTQQLVEAAEEEVKEAEKMVKKQKEVLSKQNAEINAKTRRTEEIKKMNSEKGLEIQEMEHNIKKAVETKQDADRRLRHMLEEYDWIQAEKQFFGQPNTIYDFKVCTGFEPAYSHVPTPVTPKDALSVLSFML